MKGKLAAALSGAALLFALTGCGDDAEKAQQLNAWATTFCSGLKPQVDAQEKALADIAVVKEDEKPEALKKRLVTDIDTLARTRDSIARNLEKGGPPPVDDGRTRQQDAIKELRATAKGWSALKKQVDGLQTKDRSAFASELEDASLEIQKLSKRSDTALKKLGEGDVGVAMAKVSDCKRGGRSSTAPVSPSDATSGGADRPA